MSDMGPGQPYFDAQPVARFLNTQWNTIKTNLMAGDNQVCVGGFIFDWCDEYWKANNKSVQIGGPTISSSTPASQVTIGTRPGSAFPAQSLKRPMAQTSRNISRNLFKGYTDGVKVFYNASSWNAGELYSP